MIKEIIVTMIIIAAGIIPTMQLYKMVESEFKKSMVIVGYGVFSVAMLLYLMAIIILELS
jgi:hypothetical protein